MGKFLKEGDVYADAFYGDDTGGAGTKENPYRTVRKAESEATANPGTGSDIVIGSGLYQVQRISEGHHNYIGDGTTIFCHKNPPSPGYSMFHSLQSATGLIFTCRTMPEATGIVNDLDHEVTAFNNCVFIDTNVYIKKGDVFTNCVFSKVTFFFNKSWQGSFAGCTFDNCETQDAVCGPNITKTFDVDLDGMLQESTGTDWAWNGGTQAARVTSLNPGSELSKRLYLDYDFKPGNKYTLSVIVNSNITQSAILPKSQFFITLRSDDPGSGDIQSVYSETPVDGNFSDVINLEFEPTANLTKLSFIFRFSIDSAAGEWFEIESFSLLCDVDSSGRINGQSGAKIIDSHFSNCQSMLVDDSFKSKLDNVNTLINYCSFHGDTLDAGVPIVLDNQKLVSLKNDISGNGGLALTNTVDKTEQGSYLTYNDVFNDVIFERFATGFAWMQDYTLRLKDTNNDDNPNLKSSSTGSYIGAKKAAIKFSVAELFDNAVFADNVSKIVDAVNSDYLQLTAPGTGVLISEVKDVNRRVKIFANHLFSNFKTDSSLWEGTPNQYQELFSTGMGNTLQFGDPGDLSWIWSGGTQAARVSRFNGSSYVAKLLVVPALVFTAGTQYTFAISYDSFLTGIPKGGINIYLGTNSDDKAQLIHNDFDFLGPSYNFQYTPAQGFSRLTFEFVFSNPQAGDNDWFEIKDITIDWQETFANTAKELVDWESDGAPNPAIDQKSTYDFYLIYSDDPADPNFVVPGDPDKEVKVEANGIHFNHDANTEFDNLGIGDAEDTYDTTQKNQILGRYFQVGIKIKD